MAARMMAKFRQSACIMALLARAMAMRCECRAVLAGYSYIALDS
jgi:hypothetical protein